MDFQKLIQPDIQAFIAKNIKSDVATLALKKPPCENWPYPLILDQIKARQKAMKKLPLWLTSHPNIIFPRTDILEQASSTATALYKAFLVKGETFLDLTGGCGVDTWGFSKYFENGLCVEHHETAAALINHNMSLLTKKHINVLKIEAEHFVADMKENIDLAYIDPQRRETAAKQGKRGLFKFEECSPNILMLLPTLLQKAHKVMIKTSPVLDINQAIKTLGHVEEVHIIEWQGECKEVLYILSPEGKISLENIPLKAVTIDDDGKILKEITFTRKQEHNAKVEFSMPLNYLYEPGPAFLKAGCFRKIAQHYNLQKLHPHTHLYTSQAFCHDFPGRSFEIKGIFPVDRKALPVKKANLSLRNFPSNIEDLKKHLKIKDGGGNYLFACALHDKSKKLLLAEKTNQKHLKFN